MESRIKRILGIFTVAYSIIGIMNISWAYSIIGNVVQQGAKGGSFTVQYKVFDFTQYLYVVAAIILIYFILLIYVYIGATEWKKTS